MPKEKLLKITAEIQEIPVEPEFHAVFVCPHCNTRQSEELFDEEENKTITVKCYMCSEDIKVKIPKYL